MIRPASGVLILLTLLGPCLTHAGECTRTDEEYLRILERGVDTVSSDATPAPGEIAEALNCLVYARIDLARWAGPRTAAYFATLHKVPFHARFVAACTPYVLGRGRVAEADRPDIAFEAASALAMCGVAECAGRDVFGILTQGDPRNRARVPYLALASLADRRTLSFLTARYDSLSTAPPTRDSGFWKTQIVNCLYHLPGDSVITFAEAIAASDPDTAVVSRARHVVAVRRRH